VADQGTPTPGGNRHIIAIGASSGGLRPLAQILAALPADLPASVFIVVHLGASSHLAHILGCASKLPVVSAVNGAGIETGKVYVAVPGQHMLIHDSHLLLRRGPRENYARPAIDPLFRSAACTFGGAVVGVVLSGALNDGTAGLRAIKRCGGLAVVQDPSDAVDPSMPLSAIRNVAVDHCVSAAGMAPLLATLAEQPAGPTPSIPVDIRLETAIAAQELAGMKAQDSLGTPSRFTCPECQGTLWEIVDGSLLRFRCHVGHASTGEAVLAKQAGEVEQMLWSLLRMHQERAELARRMAERERASDRLELVQQFQRRAQEYDEDAEVVRRLLRDTHDVPETLNEQGGL
jgi:two-component system chemotaxis response regulator CheB